MRKITILILLMLFAAIALVLVDSYKNTKAGKEYLKSLNVDLRDAEDSFQFLGGYSSGNSKLSSDEILRSQAEELSARNATTSHALGEAYLREDNKQQAIEAFSVAALSGDSRVAYQIGELYSGNHTDVSSKNATLWFSLSARRNHLDAEQRAQTLKTKLTEEDLNWVLQQIEIHEDAEREWKRQLIKRLDDQLGE